MMPKQGDMETINGTVRRLQPLRTAGRWGVMWYKLEFLLGGQPVELTLADPLRIENGDELLVAGRSRPRTDPMLITAGAALSLIGLFTIPLLIGFALVPVGIRLVNRGRVPADGRFRADAFYNRTRREYGNGHTTLAYVTGGLLCVVGMATLPLVIGLVALPLGLHVVRTARRNVRALEAISPILTDQPTPERSGFFFFRPSVGDDDRRRKLVGFATRPFQRRTLVRGGLRD